MSENFRTALASAVVDELAALLPDVRVARGRRSEVGEDEMPLLLVSTGEARADDTMSPGETFWSVAFTVTAFLLRPSVPGESPDDADAATEDALAAMEGRVLSALHNKTLSTPDGSLPLTCGIEPTGSSIDVTEAEDAAERQGTVSLDFRVIMVLPTRVTSFP